MPGQAASLIAHQGGWDEILFVLAPIALFAGLLALANKRAAAALAERDACGTGQAGDADGPSHGTSSTRDGHGVGAAPEERRGPGRPTG